MDANQLLIIDIQGSAGIVLEDGSIRALSLGDSLTVGDVIITAENSSVMIDIKGMSLSIPANQRVKITPDLVAETTRDSSETTIFDASIDDAIASLNQPNSTDETSPSPLTEDVSDFLSALESDGDLLDTLEATAAGGNATTGSGGGTSFVELARIAEGIEPSSLSFDDSFTANNDDIFSLRDTTGGVVPETTLIGSLELNDIGLINNPQPIISGTSTNLEGQTVLITITDALGNVQTIDVVVQPDGTFTSPELESLPDGPIVVEVIATGPDGNPISDNIAADIDTTAPLVGIDTLADSALPVVVITGSVVGLVAGDDVTLTVTDSSGQVQTFVTQIDDQGNWSVTTAALAEGAYGVQANAVDEAGNQGNAQTTAIIDLTAPVIVIDAIADTNDSTPTLTGTVNGVAVGTQISITIVASDGVVQALTATVTADGNWSVGVVDTLAEGQFTVTASVADSAGNQAQDNAVGVIDLTNPVISIDQLNDSNDQQPTISGITQGLAAGSQVIVTIVDSNGQQQTVITQTNASGVWSIAVASVLAEGPYSVTATTQDTAGNTAQDTETGLIDLTAPTINLDPPANSADDTPVISGQVNGVAVGTMVTIVVTDANGVQQTLMTSVLADGGFAIEVGSALAQGSYSVTATVTDNAGNQAADTQTGIIDSSLLSVTIDVIGETNDTTPSISGTSLNAVAGDTVSVLITGFDGQTQLLTTQVDNNGDWSVTPTIALVEGGVSVTATLTDSLGNIVSDNATGIIDITAPILTIDNLDTVSDSTPIISGQTDEPAGSVVSLVVTDGVNSQNLTAIVNTDGSWSVEVPIALQNGTINVDASITDIAGNQATASDAFILNSNAPSISIDTVADGNDVTPTISGTSDAPDGTLITVVITDSNNSQTLNTTVIAGVWSVDAEGALAEGEFTVDASITVNGLTSDAQATGIIDTLAPTFDIDPLAATNDTTPTITGSSNEIGGLVSITVTDVNGAVQTLTATVLADGTWSVDVPTPLAEGAFQVDASVTDAAGNTASDTENGGVIDTQAPSFDIDPLAATNDTTPTITGSSDEIGGLVSITVTDANGAVQTLTATVLADGTWSVDVPTPLAEGAYQVDASVTDAAGNTASDTENGGVIDTQAPTFDIDLLSDSNDTTPTITGSSDEIGGLVSITVTDANGAVQTLTATVLADGTWSVDVPTPLAEGAYQVDGSVTDTAGNTASDTENGGVVDTQAPTFDIDPLSDSNDTTPTITGSSDEIGGLVSITVTGANGAVQTLTATVLADGTWSVDVLTPLAEGAYQVDASVTDAAGNTASDTENGGVIDTLAPSFDIDPLAATNDTTPTITGSSDEIGGLVSITVTDANGAVQTLTATVLADGTWSVDVPTPLAEGTYQVDASVTDAAGNTASDTENGGVIDTLAPSVTIDAPALTNDNTPVVTGTSDLASSDIAVTFTDANGSHTVTVQTNGSGNWSAEATQPLIDGAYTVTASLTDAAGNTGSASDNGVVDTIAPELTFVPTFLLGQLVSLNGTSDLPAGSTITITENLLGGGIGATYTTTTDANGDWTLVGLTIPLLTVASVTASATDEAGNTRTINSTDFDSTPPTLTVSVDTLSNDNTPAINGTTDAGQGAAVTVVVTDKDGNTETLTATVDANGNWAISPTTPLPDGTFSVDVSVRDSVGNETTDSISGVIDTTAPSLTVQGVGAGSDVT
ncbi:retention module-containing protein, partial [Pseudoalteromonas arctica]